MRLLSNSTAQQNSKRPKIVPVFESTFKNSSQNRIEALYLELLQDLFDRAVPQRCLSCDEEELEDYFARLLETMPIVTWSPDQPHAGKDFSILLVCPYRPNAYKFFFEMMTHHLVPGIRQNALSIFAIDFKMPELSDNVYTLCELIIKAGSEEEVKILKESLPVIAAQTRIGIESSYQARRILEARGLDCDEQTALIQEQVAYLRKSQPTHFDFDIFTEMQQVLVLCSDAFKAQRESRHLSRLIAVFYLFRKNLRDACAKDHQRRHLFIKIARSKVRSDGGLHPVLSIVVGMNFLGEYEVLEERQFLGAIRNYVPSANLVAGSFFVNRRKGESICTMYLEIEKTDSTEFSSEETARLKRELSKDLHDRVEHLMHPVFMPANEEEIMRNILILADQLSFVRDLPQVIISFCEQTERTCTFQVILLRLLRQESPALSQLFEGALAVKFQPDRTKIVGTLRKKYPKEANVFRLEIDKEPFMRQDRSLDLQKARQYVLESLFAIVGEMRDFNGGMILKQNELLCSLRHLLGSVAKSNEFLLENFFYSLEPAVARTLTEAKTLKILFETLLEHINEGIFIDDGFRVWRKESGGKLYVLVRSDDAGVKDELARITSESSSGIELISSCIIRHDACYMAIVLTNPTETKRLELEEILSKLKPLQIQ